MSSEVLNASFWLPSHFLTDDTPPLTNSMSNSGFGFGFGFESDVFDTPNYKNSTHIDKSNSKYEYDDVLSLSHVTRQLAQTALYDNIKTPSQPQGLFSTSPQSTLTGIGGDLSAKKGPLSPELESDAAWELLYEAAGQVARMKMGAIAARMSNNNGSAVAGFGSSPSSDNNLSHQRLNNELKWAHNRSNQGNQENEVHCRCRYHQSQRSSSRSLGHRPSTWRPLTTPRPRSGPHMGSFHQGGTGGMGPTQSVGTGVFLPRTVSTSPPTRHQYNQPQPQPQGYEFLRKPTVVLPEAKVQQLTFTNQSSQSRISSSGLHSDREFMLARRNVILEQQRRNFTRTENKKAAMSGQGRQLCLPNDWTY